MYGRLANFGSFLKSTDGWTLFAAKFEAFWKRKLWAIAASVGHLKHSPALHHPNYKSWASVYLFYKHAHAASFCASLSSLHAYPMRRLFYDKGCLLGRLERTV